MLVLKNVDNRKFIEVKTIIALFETDRLMKKIDCFATAW